MININIRVDETLYHKLKKDKAKTEENNSKRLTWGDYIKILYDISE